MRLLIVSQYFWPENFRVNEIAQDLAARGHEVTVLTGKPNYPSGEIFADYRKAPGAFSAYCGAEIIRVPLVPRGKTNLSLMLNYISFVVSGVTIGTWRLAGRSFDAIFVCQLSPITSALPSLLQKFLKRAPVAMWVLDLWPDTLSAIGMVRKPWVLAWVGGLVSFIYRHCDRILVSSRAFVPSIERHSDLGKSVCYLPSFAENPFDDADENVAAAPELAAFRDTFNVMFAGNIGEAQDMPTVLAAALTLRHRPDIRWLIVGDGRAVDEVRSSIKTQDLDKQVVMLGRHPVEKMPSFFAGADALLLSLKPEPTFAMTVPAKLQSYFRSGKPIVAMLDGEGARIVAESGGGLVAAAGDAAALARAVSKLADMAPEERLKIGAKGRDYSKREFDRATIIDRLERCLLEMVGQNRRTAA